MLLRAVRHKRDAGTGTPAGLTDTKEGHRYMLMAFTMESNRLRAVFLRGNSPLDCFPHPLGDGSEEKMLESIDRIIVENITTGEVLAVITNQEVTTASDDIVVRMRPQYD